MEDILFSSQKNIGYLKKRGGIAVIMETDSPAAAKTTTGIIKGEASGVKVANWGDDNDFPRMIKKLLDKDAEMKELINTCVLFAMGGGVAPFQETGVNDDGASILTPIKDLAIREFYQSPMIEMYMLEGFQDLFTYFNVFPELITSKDRTQINSITINEAFDSRWEEMGDDGRLKRVIHNKNWPSPILTDPKETTYIPALDPYDRNIVKSVKENKAFTKFIYPVSYPTIGQTYYQLAHWDGLRVSGWLDIASKIPEFKAALLTNQMTIKYLIRIPNHYWLSVYPKWSDLDETQQAEKKKLKLNEINKSLTDVENTGKSILNEVGYDPMTKEKLPGWEIEVIDDKTKAGAFLEDSQEASAHKMRALGLDNSLVGNLMTGNGMGAGSGSDKRIAWNIYMAKIRPYRRIMLAPLLFAAEFNGWKDQFPGFRLGILDSIGQTLDNAHSTTKEVIGAA